MHMLTSRDALLATSDVWETLVGWADDFTVAYEEYAPPTAAAHKTYILREFSTLNVSIPDKAVLAVEHLVIGFETRGSHALALNGQLLGVHPIAFTDSDRAALFHIFNVSEAQVAALVRRIPTIDPTHKVRSDPFNLFCAWLLHVAAVVLQNPKVRASFQLNVAKYLHYRFFTSLVNHNFSHGANEAIMLATINSLSRKFDIVVHGTWREAIEARCRDLLDTSSIHYRAIQTVDPDESLLYLISDTQTRMRDKIKNIVAVYYEMRERGAAVTSRAAVTEIDGEKLLVHSVSAFDAVVANLCAEVMSVHAFVDQATIQGVARLFPAVSVPMLKAALVKLSQRATTQNLVHQLDQEKTIKGQKIHVGVRALITAVVQSSLRYCIKNGINVSNRMDVLIKVKNVYASSRITDPNINAVKASVAHFVDNAGLTNRESTRSSLRLALIAYVIVRGFRFM